MRSDTPALLEGIEQVEQNPDHLRGRLWNAAPLVRSLPAAPVCRWRIGSACIPTDDLVVGVVLICRL